MLQRPFIKLFKGVSIGLTTGAGIASWYFLHQNDYELSSIGAIRFARAGIAASTIIADYKWNLMGVTEKTEKYQETMKKCHQRGADRLLNLAKANGGVFIKVGQHIAALQYLLPDEYTTTLSVLHSRAPESDLAEVKKVFQESVGKDLEDVFVSFNLQPCGVASLAQVHEAYLRTTNEKVAVKIQHPKVKSRSTVDIATMEFFIKVADKLFPDFKLVWLVNETKRNLPRELDFRHEAHNADRVRRMFDHLPFLKVPKIYYDYSSDKVLTMEFCEGAQINDYQHFKKEGIDVNDICRKIGRLYSEMIFIQGYIHCDPHPGNVLVQKNPITGTSDIVLLDHGLYSTLADEFRTDYCHLWVALLNADKDAIKRISEKMNIGEFYSLFACIVTSRSWTSVTSGIHKSDVSESERMEIQQFAASLIPQISQLLDKMPREMLLILKTNDLLRAIERSLGISNRNETFVEMSRCVAWADYQDNMKVAETYRKEISLVFKLCFTLFKIYLATWYFALKSYVVKEKPSTALIL